MPHGIELKTWTCVLKTPREGAHVVSCQSMVFKVGKSKVRDRSKLKGRNLKNPTKGQGISLKLHRKMGNSMIGFIKHYPYKKNKIKVFKINHPTMGGRVFERVNQLMGFLKDSGETK